MGWIVGISSEQGDLRVVELARGGTRTVPLSKVDLRLIDTDSQSGSRIRERFELEFSELSVCTDVAKLRGLGVPEAALVCQTVFEYHQRTRTFYLPSQVLIRGLFCRNGLAANHLLSPMGYRDLAILAEGKDGVAEVARLPAWRERQLKEEFTSSFKQTLMWILAYPSAQRMVASVFKSALVGRFDCRLPLGKARLRLAGVALGPDVLVQNVFLEWVLPLEKPSGGLSGKVPPMVVFRDPRRVAPVRGVARRKPSTDATLFLGAGGWRLTDAEWAEISAIHRSTLAGDTLHGSDPRTKLEMVLKKLSEGVSWAQVGEAPSDGKRACSYWRALRKDGRWERIKRYLNESRTPSVQPDEG